MNDDNTKKENTQNQIKEGNREKTLDDLFLKTKTEPCIYYKPLSEEEIKLKLQNKITNKH